MPSLTLAAIAEQCGIPRPACGERATRAEQKPDLGWVRGRFHKLRLAEAPPHPDLLPASGEKETAVRPGHVRNKRQRQNTSLQVRSVRLGRCRRDARSRAATNPRLGECGVKGENHGELRSPGLQDAAAPLVAGRGCGTCSLCCKVLPVRELDKPAGRWCVHSVRGGGCGVHSSRPQACRQFFCSWRLDPNLGPEWKPEVSPFVLSADPAYQAL